MVNQCKIMIITKTFLYTNKGRPNYILGVFIKEMFPRYLQVSWALLFKTSNKYIIHMIFRVAKIFLDGFYLKHLNDGFYSYGITLTLNSRPIYMAAFV